MGLDIVVYNKLEGSKAALESDSDEFHDQDFLHLYANPDFPGREEGLDLTLAYKGNRVHSFRAGSYSGYGEWRERLARLAGYPRVSERSISSYDGSHSAGAWSQESGPFWELINFSDCEGIIGPVVSAKLARDFQEFQEKADASSDNYFRENYALWRKAFELAADNGVVRFA